MVKTTQEIAEDFIKEYGALVAKYNMDFAHYPVFIPDEQGFFKLKLQSTPVDIGQTKKDV